MKKMCFSKKFVLILISIFIGIAFSLSAQEEDNTILEKVAVVNELGKYLKGASLYCKKLKERAFHFICREKVTITLREFNWERDIIEQVKSYRFDYQLINNKGQITEQRRLISRDSISDKKVSVKNLVVSFLSERPVFGPRTLLAEDRQHKFRYEIVKTIKNKNQRFVVIRVIPKKAEEVFFSSGEVWVDTEKFSVRKLQVVLKNTEKYKKLIQFASGINKKLHLICEVEYDQSYKGLYFPTKVNIIEKYIRSGYRSGYKEWVRSKTIFSYKDYKFFNVNTDVRFE